MSSNKENNNEINSNQVSSKTFRVGVPTSTAKSFADLPDTIFCIIIECLDWCEVGRFDTALLNRNMRKSYLVALKLRKVKVEGNRFWGITLRKGILN